VTTYYTSNDPSIGFDATAAGTLPADWTAKVGTWQAGTTAPVGSHTHSFASTTNANGDAALLTGISAVANMQVSYTEVMPGGVPSGAQPVMVPILRSDSGYNNCYTFVILPNGAGVLQYSLYKRISGSYSLVAQTNCPQSFSTSGPITLNVVAQASGTSISIKAWQTGTTAPSSWDWTVTDSSISAAGYAGLYNSYSGSGARAVDDFTVADTGGDAETITVTTPGTEIAGNSYTYSGSYTGTQPAALDYQFDSAGWSAASSPTIGGGSWSFTATAPSAGTHTLSVRDHNVASISGTSGSSTTSGAETISVTTPGTETAGNSYTYSGTYTGGPPTALDYQFDSAGWNTASGPTIGGGTWSFSATAPSAGSHTLSVRDHNNTSVSGSSGNFTTSAGETITVTTPGTETAGNSYTYSGTYTGGPPTALDYQFDSAGWNTASGPTIGGGTWSFSATAPSAGSHTLSVRDHNNTPIWGSSGSFTTVSTAIAITTPSGLIIAGQSLTVSGTYTGTAPTGLNYRIDGGSYVAASGPTISGGNWSFAITAPAFGSHSITVQESNATSVTATSSAFTVSAAPNNSAIVYSPYNWNVGGGAAITINAGAYFRTLFSGASCTLNFNAANMASPASELWWRVDDGPLTQANVAATVSVTIPPATTSNADVPYHLLEVIVKSTTETANRWNSVASATGTAVIFQGLTLAAAAALVAPGVAAKNLLIYGDSITEGVRTLGESAANDTDRNDAWMGWAYRLGALLGAEVGVVGFGGSGLSVTGSGNVPVLGTSYSLLYSGAARSFSPAPDMVVFNEGTNDGSTNIVAAMTGVLNGIIAACPGAIIVVLRPFNGNRASNLQAAIAACNNPPACHYVDTTGFFNTAYGADSMNLHPSGPNDVGLIAPQIAAQLKPLLGGSRAPAFGGGFQHSLLG
jgi:lysophospholipase L1-like esterase